MAKQNPYSAKFGAASPYEVSARQLKAQKLASHFKARNIKSTDLAKMHPSLVAHHLMTAGVSGASDETLGEVHKLLKFQEDVPGDRDDQP